MPKAIKLHAKGKSSSIQKVSKTEKECSDNKDPDESMREFQLQLCWCIQQLERSLAEKKGNEKQLQESWKVLTVLKNNNQSVIRKRQLMRTHFGDYRAKMAAEEKKLAKMASKIKICDSPAQPKATFLRKSAFLTTGDNSFRFNFNLSKEQHIDTENTETNEESIIVNNNINTDAISKDDNDPKSKIVQEKEAKEETNSRRFKFNFSSSDFKFNFKVGDS